MVQPRRSARTAANAAATAVAPPVVATPTKKKAKASGSTPSKVKGLVGAPAPSTNVSLGIVDPQSGFSKDATIHRSSDGAEFDAMLNLLDVSQNMDKYYILQVVRETKGKKVEYHCYSRWGRTGTAGTCQTFTTKDEKEAVEKFEDKFQEKTGQSWSKRDAFQQKPGKYKLLKVDHTTRAPAGQLVMWQYYVDDQVDGKPNGWYDYDDAAAMVVEDLMQQFLANPEMNTRVVQSGHFLYVVNLLAGTQTNTSTNKKRSIRRTGQGTQASEATPATPVATSKSKRKGSASVSTPSPPASTLPPSTSKRQKNTAAAPVPAPVTPSPAKGKAPAPPTPATKTKASAANWVSGQALVNAMGSGSVDPTCPKSSTARLVADFDVMLNQTDIKANKNKFYLIQLIEEGGEHFVWTRWGRVGEIGMSQMQGPIDLASAEEEYAKKFKAKTGNNWEDRKNFVVKAGKYEIVEIEAQDPSSEQPNNGAAKVVNTPTAVSTLDPTTRSLVELIFNEDMFKDAMSALDLDTDRIPLGRLSKAQVQKGMDLLEEIETTIKANGSTVDLSSRFYQAIPHNCGRRQPPAISTLAEVQRKFDLLNVLGDIEVAQNLVRGGGSGLHPTDEKYQGLQAKLNLLDKKSSEFKVLEKYLANTKNYNAAVDNIWRVDRDGEASRFALHSKLSNRKLLWHGTNIAVAAAILKSGLRIMPHSGGRVGRGIYLASECAKSQGYVRGTQIQGRYLGVMFLVEAALGKEQQIMNDDPRLVAPPTGFNSVVAMGRQEPDPKHDTSLEFDGLKVAVPQGKPVTRQEYAKSSFYNSEYLLYDESQHRIRYVLTVWL